MKLAKSSNSPFIVLLCCTTFKSEALQVLCDINGIRTHNQLVRKPTLIHLAKLASMVMNSLFMN